MHTKTILNMSVLWVSSVLTAVPAAWAQTPHPLASVQFEAFKPDYNEQKTSDLQTKISPLQTSPLGARLKWQKAPTGSGEFLPFPNPATVKSFLWGERQMIGTRLGLLCRENLQGWRVVSSLYGKSVRVVGEDKAKQWLWVEQEKAGMVALDQNLKIVRRLPTVQGDCMAIEPQGFWCREAGQLIEYDARGQEKRRFKTEGLSLVPAKVGKRDEAVFGTPVKIAWVSVDSDAVWLSLHDYRFAGFGGNDAPLTRGTERIGRLDRAKGTFTAIDWAPAREDGRYSWENERQFLDLSQHIQWFGSDDGKTWGVYQLNKKTLQVSRDLEVHGNGVGVVANDQFLWEAESVQNPALVYSRKSLKPVAPKIAGERPLLERLGRTDFYTMNAVTWMGILSKGIDNVWLSASPNILLQIPDKGSPKGYEMFPAILPSSPASLNPLFASNTCGGQLLWAANGQLIQTQSHSKVKRVSLVGEWFEDGDEVKADTFWLGASARRVWCHLQYRQPPFKKDFVSLKRDLSEPRQIKPITLTDSEEEREPFHFIGRVSVAIDDCLYTFHEGYLLRIDGATGEIRVVESWLPLANTPGGSQEEIQKSPRWRLGRRCKSAFALPDGRIAFTFEEARKFEQFGMGGYLTDLLDKARLFLYDPTNDSWQESNSSPDIQPISLGAILYGYNVSQLFRWQGNDWALIGKRPLSTPLEVPTWWLYQLDENRVAATNTYLYQETALGLYRVAWKDVALDNRKH